MNKLFLHRYFLIVILCLVVIAVGAMWLWPKDNTKQVNQVVIPASDNGISYDSLYFPPEVTEEKIREDLTFIKSQNVESLYVSANEKDLENPAKMEKIIKVGRELGFRLYINPYIGGIFSGNEGGSSKIYLDAHPNSAQTTRGGIEVDVPSINDPEFVAYMKKQIDGFAGYDFDGFQFDEPSIGNLSKLYDSYEGDYYPYDRFSRELFTQKYGYQMPYYQNQDVSQFRSDTMDAFLKELMQHAKSQRPDWIITAVVFGDKVDTDHAGTGDWHGLAHLKALDILMIDPYWYPSHENGWEWFTSCLHALVSATNGAHARPGIWARGYGLTEKYENISKTLDYAEDQGVHWQAVWITGEQRNADEAAVWKEIADSFKKGNP